METNRLSPLVGLLRICSGFEHYNNGSEWMQRIYIYYIQWPQNDVIHMDSWGLQSKPRISFGIQMPLIWKLFGLTSRLPPGFTATLTSRFIILTILMVLGGSIYLYIVLARGRWDIIIEKFGYYNWDTQRDELQDYIRVIFSSFSMSFLRSEALNALVG